MSTTKDGLLRLVDKLTLLGELSVAEYGNGDDDVVSFNDCMKMIRNSVEAGFKYTPHAGRDLHYVIDEVSVERLEALDRQVAEDVDLLALFEAIADADHGAGAMMETVDDVACKHPEWFVEGESEATPEPPKDPYHGRRGHKLMTTALEKQFPAWMSTDGQGDEAMVIAKYFHPASSYTWYAIEYDATNREFFGWVYGPFPELGYFSLTELEQTLVKGLPVERDLYFEPTTLGEVKKLHRETF